MVKLEIEDYKKLLKRFGSKVTHDIIDTLGISYNENFTEAHTKDPIFSEPLDKFGFKDPKLSLKLNKDFYPEDNI